MAKRTQAKNAGRIDPTWPEFIDGQLPVSELAADRQGALSPFGDVVFPLKTVPYVHPDTKPTQAQG